MEFLPPTKFENFLKKPPILVFLVPNFITLLSILSSPPPPPPVTCIGFIALEPNLPKADMPFVKIAAIPCPAFTNNVPPNASPAIASKPLPADVPKNSDTNLAPLINIGPIVSAIGSNACFN